ncbi:MFS transporter [Paenibacillus sp.]|uniref:MFS transporter n=1 Tax=Paenibacillus sp. TaxID=58172 RepID=UPI002D6DD0A9|nr:MFS transporter [Paenibacillus sp.]HZG56670.1 MFS transporter [Paenibacillus sp.]
MDKRMGVIMVMLLTIFLGFGIIIPVLPEMIVGSGEERFHLYVMLAVYSAASFLLSPVWGALSDRIGRKPVLMVGVLGFSVSFLMFGLSDGQLTLMYASRVLGGVFSGATTACAVAYVADITPEERRTRAMGLVGMSIGLGFIFGPGIGGLLSVFGNEAPFFAAAALALLNFFFAFGTLQESLPAERRRAAAAAPKQSRWTAFQGPIVYLFLMMFVLTFALAGLESTLQYYQIERYAATPQDIGILFLVSGIVGALVQGGFVRRYAKNGTEPLLIRVGLTLQALGFVLLLFSKDVWTASAFMSVFAIGNSLLRPCVTSLITQSTRAGQGVTNGLSSSMDSLGRIAGPLIAGGLFELDMSLPFFVGAGVSLAAMLLLGKYLSLGGRSSAGPADAAG